MIVVKHRDRHAEEPADGGHSPTLSSQARVHHTVDTARAVMVLLGGPSGGTMSDDMGTFRVDIEIENHSNFRRIVSSGVSTKSEALDSSPETFTRRRRRSRSGSRESLPAMNRSTFTAVRI